MKKFVLLFTVVLIASLLPLDGVLAIGSNPFLECSFRGSIGTGANRVRFIGEGKGETFILRANSNPVSIGRPSSNGSRLRANVLIQPSGQVTASLHSPINDASNIYFKGSTCEALLAAATPLPLIGGTVFNTANDQLDFECRPLAIARDKLVPVLLFSEQAEHTELFLRNLKEQKVRYSILNSAGRLATLNIRLAELAKIETPHANIFIGEIPDLRYFSHFSKSEQFSNEEGSPLLVYKLLVARSKKKASSPKASLSWDIPQDILLALNNANLNAVIAVDIIFEEKADFDVFEQQANLIELQLLETEVVHDASPYYVKIKGRPDAVRALLSNLTQAYHGAVTFSLPVKRVPKQKL